MKTPIFHVKTRSLSLLGVEALIWINSYLLSSHLDGSILIHQLHRPGSLVWYFLLNKFTVYLFDSVYFREYKFALHHYGPWQLLAVVAFGLGQTQAGFFFSP